MMESLKKTAAGMLARVPVENLGAVVMAWTGFVAFSGAVQVCGMVFCPT